MPPSKRDRYERKPVSPRLDTPEIIALIIKRREQGLTFKQIGTRLGMNRHYAYQLYREHSGKRPQTGPGSGGCNGSTEV